MQDKKPKPDDPEQSKRFEQTAKELGVDESGKSFDRAVSKIVRKPALRKSRENAVRAPQARRK